jgi:photosystem II stability/assembly factor-like uncharacterized protein
MGVFKSTNAGATWSAINTGLGDFASVSALIIDPIRPATLYAAIQDNDVFTTTNGGESWSALESNLVGVLIYTLAWDPANPTILYAGTANGVYVLGKKSGI